MTGLPGGSAAFIAVSILAFTILGSVLEGIPAIVLFGPLLFPIARAVGVHEVHYAMVIILAMGIGLFAPPFGVGDYAACAISRIHPDEGIKPMLGYVLALLIGTIVIAAVPARPALKREPFARGSDSRPHHAGFAPQSVGDLRECRHSMAKQASLCPTLALEQVIDLVRGRVNREHRMHFRLPQMRLLFFSIHHAVRLNEGFPMDNEVYPPRAGRACALLKPNPQPAMYRCDR